MVDQTTRVIPLSGTKKDWRMWPINFNAWERVKACVVILLGIFKCNRTENIYIYSREIKLRKTKKRKKKIYS